MVSRKSEHNFSNFIYDFSRIRAVLLGETFLNIQFFNAGKTKKREGFLPSFFIAP